MFRLAVPLALLVACNPPEGKDRDTVLTNMHATESGAGVAGFEILMGVDELARSYENEVEITIGGVFQADDPMDIELSVLDGLNTIATAWRTSSEDSSEAEFSPNFEACVGNGFTERVDGGCDYAVAALMVADRPRSLLIGFSLRSQAPKGTDGEDVEVYIDAIEAQPQ